MDKSKRVAFLTVEIPPKEGKNLMEVESFQSIPCMTDYEAEENVSEFAIAHFISHNNVTINDLNYGLFVETFRQLHHCMSWSQLLQISHENLRIEKSILLNAHMELLRRLSSICVSYSDILPLASCAIEPQPAGVCMEPIIYTGSKPPVTRHELFAWELFNILQRNSPDGNPIVD